MNFFFMYNKVYSDRSELDLSDGTIRIQIFFSVKSYDEKTAENYRNSYVAEKPIVLVLVPNFDSTDWNAE